MTKNIAIEKSQYERDIDGLTAYCYRVEVNGHVRLAGYNYQTKQLRDAGLSRAMESLELPIAERFGTLETVPALSA